MSSETWSVKDPAVARLVYGSVDDLKSSLQHTTDVSILRRALAAARILREGKTKVQILERHLRKLQKA